MLNCPTPPSQSRHSKHHIKKSHGLTHEPRFFKELFAALKAEKGVLQTPFEVKSPPTAPATTPKNLTHNHKTA